MLRPTVPPAEAADGQAAPPDDADTEGRGDASAESTPAPARSRRKRTAPTGKTQGRKLHLTDDVHDRLFFLSRQRKQSVSAVANDLLDKALPKFELKRVN